MIMAKPTNSESEVGIDAFLSFNMNPALYWPSKEYEIKWLTHTQRIVGVD